MLHRKPEGKRALGRPRHIWVGDKLDLEERGIESVERTSGSG